MVKKELVKKLIKKYGRPYSEQLGIKVNKGEREIFKWFMASLLFGKPIREETAMNTYKLFIKEKINTPNKIIAAGWDRLVKILDSGGYVRYDFSTATKLLEIMKKLREEYRGKITNIHHMSNNSKDLEKRLLLFKGIGPTTVGIFLRELRVVWRKADPKPLPDIKNKAKELGINLGKLNRKTKKFIMLECALHRLTKNKTNDF